MRDIKTVFAILGFFAGILSFHLYYKVNYVSLSKPTPERSVAMESSDQQPVIDDIRNKIMLINSKADLLKVRQEIIELAKANPNFLGVQIFKMFVEPLPLFEGILWRLRGIVEDTDLTHLAILYRLRQIYENRYIYGPHVEVLFHYLTDPPKDPAKTMFKKISEVQNFLAKEVLPGMEMMLFVARDMMAAKPELFQFEFDKSIWVGEDKDRRFLDPDDAKKTFIRPYMSYIISGLARMVGTIYYLDCYNLDDTPAAMNEVLKFSAINNMTNRFLTLGKGRGLPQVITRKEIYEQLRKFPTLLKARYDESTANQKLQKSFDHFALAAQSDLEGYVCSIKYPEMIIQGEEIPADYNCKDLERDMLERDVSQEFVRIGFQEEEHFVVKGKYFLLDPNQLLLNHKVKFNELSERARLYRESKNGEAVILASDVTGKKISINVRAAFKYQESLQKYFPTTFDDIDMMSARGGFDIRGVGQWVTPEGPGTKRREWAWNYTYGRPRTWRPDAVTFGGFLPDATNANIYELMYTMKLTNALRPFSLLFTTIY